MSCVHRCERLHPHCTLTITRTAAPDDRWFWEVQMPDGHMYDFSGSKETFDECLESMRTDGVKALSKADAIWRSSHKDRAGGGE